MYMRVMSGCEPPRFTDEWYSWGFVVHDPNKEHKVCHTFSVIAEFPHFRECWIVIEDSGCFEGEYEMIGVTLYTPTLGLRKELMDCFRAVYKTYFDYDFEITGDPTDWRGSVLDTQKNRHN